MAFDSVSAPRNYADTSLLFWWSGNEPRDQHSQPAKTVDHAKGAEYGECRSGRSQQDRCTCTHDRRQYVLSRRETGCLGRVCCCALVSRLFVAPCKQRLLRCQSARWYGKISGQLSWWIFARRRASASEWRNF